MWYGRKTRKRKNCKEERWVLSSLRNTQITSYVP